MKQPQTKLKSNPTLLNIKTTNSLLHHTALSKDVKTPQQTYKADRTLEDSVAKTQLLVSARVMKIGSKTYRHATSTVNSKITTIFSAIDMYG